MASTNPQPIDSAYFVENTMAFLIAYLLNWMLFGVLSVQAYLYYLAFPNDKAISKCLVTGVYLIEAAQTVLLSHDAYVLYTYSNVLLAIPGYATAYYVEPVVLSRIAIPVLGGIVALVVQVFYAYRLYLFADSKLILVFISTGALLQFLGALLGGVPQFSSVPFYDFFGPSLAGREQPAIFVLVWGIGSVFCDISIAVLMMYNLLQRDTGWKSTSKILLGLVRLAIETGAITAVVATTYVLFLFLPQLINYWCIPPIILGKLYSNAMMVNFNHRIRFVDGRKSRPSEMDIPSSLFRTRETQNDSRLALSESSM